MLNQFPTLDRLFSALADPARRAMLEQLSHSPVSVSGLAASLPMSLSATMQHLGVLEQAGLVSSEKIGRVRTCSINSMALSRAENWIHAQRTEWVRCLDRLGDCLATSSEQEDDNAQ